MTAERSRGRRGQRGAVAVEVALLMGQFLVVIVLVLETARLMYFWNTVEEVTRQAARDAAVTDFSDAARMAALRRFALGRGGAASLLGAAIDASYVRIDYETLDGSAFVPVAPMPSSPAHNLLNCLNGPQGGACVRFVRARLCQPANSADCVPVPYPFLLPWFNQRLGLGGALLSLPTGATRQPAESLGYLPGQPSYPLSLP